MQAAHVVLAALQLPALSLPQLLLAAPAPQRHIRIPLSLACRPGLQERARYYAVVYLNQMVLNHKQQAQAAGAWFK